MKYIIFNKSTEFPIGVVDRPMPANEVTAGTVECPTLSDIYTDTDSQWFCIDGEYAIYDKERSLSRAKELAIASVRGVSASLQEPLDTKVFSLEKTLKLDRSNTDTIEKYYKTFQRQQQIRNSSNNAQKSISSATTVKDVWWIVDNYDSFSGDEPSIAPEVTRAAFLNRLSLSMKEKSDPVFQMLTTDLLSAGYIDLRQVPSKLAPMVLYGKMTQERVDAVCNSPVSWGERPIHGV